MEEILSVIFCLEVAETSLGDRMKMVAFNGSDGTKVSTEVRTSEHTDIESARKYVLSRVNDYFDNL